MEVVYIIGPLCSGKTTYANELKAKGYELIEIGAIVRNITKTVYRTHNSDLAEEIGIRLVEKITTAVEQNQRVAVVGLRQRSLLNEALSCAPYSHTRIVWLEAPYEVLKARFDQRNEKKDLQMTFEEAYKFDQQLGLEDLEGYLKKSNLNNFIKIQIINTNDNTTIQESK